MLGKSHLQSEDIGNRAYRYSYWNDHAGDGGKFSGINGDADTKGR